MNKDEFLKYMNTKIDSICMSYRHDYYLLDVEEREMLKLIAKEFVIAISKEWPKKIKTLEENQKG